MAVNNSEEQSVQSRRTFGQMAKQAGLFVLFAAILTIPRIRRLRRRAWAWACVRLSVAACATWLGWRYTHAGAGLATLALSLLLFAFSLFIHAKPTPKSVDALAHELDALIVLNGGIFRESPGSAPVHKAQIFVHPEKIIVLGPDEHRLLEIPLTKVRNLAANPVANGGRESVEPWKVEINWMADAPCETTFHYDGAFAEHLARITESTLRSQWKKELPILPS
jgi:hypothetical protein